MAELYFSICVFIFSGESKIRDVKEPKCVPKRKCRLFDQEM